CIRLLSGLPPQSLTLMRGNEPVKINSLKFTGGDGSGKTMLAAIVGMSAIKAGLSVKYLEWSDIVATMSDYEQRTEQNDIVAQ
ncbi:ATP-binding protein, partial [Salmonella enterica]|uniref:ATP-binding protein n=1 Tax=Salmonella enterica TaxID=28901 RepID=UPI003D299F7D